MRIAVIGAGGVGGFFGGKLAQHGEEVWFIARGSHLETIKEDGLYVESVDGDFHLTSLLVTDDPSFVGVVDVVLLAVKTWQVEDTLSIFHSILGPHSVIVPLQNGVETPGILAEAVGKQNVAGGLCEIMSFLSEPGRIRHVAGQPKICMGELEDGENQRLHQLQQLLNAAGIEASVSSHIMRDVWEKFIYMTAAGGVGTVTRAPIGVVRNDAGTRELLTGCVSETIALAHAMGIDMPDDQQERSMATLDALPAETMPSMQRDIMAGRPSELDAWTGAIVRLGQEHQVPTPLNHFIFNALKHQEGRARNQLSWERRMR